MTKTEILEKFKNIRLLALDFDGTLTVGALVFFDQDGREAVICSRRDSLGVDMLQKSGIQAIVISKETNPVVEARCRKMNVFCISGAGGAKDKLTSLINYAKKAGFDKSQVAFMGDDINDIPCLEYAGIGIAVKDAQPQVRAVADYIVSADGGRGAVREVCELILAANGVEIAD